MTDTDLITFIRTQKWGVISSVTNDGQPQSALVGIAVDEQFELIFDTLESTRKARNLKANPKMACVIGGWSDGDERTVQYEGLADFPREAELAKIKQTYFHAFPDGPARLSWPGITYVRVRPVWLRYSDFKVSPPLLVERNF